jgi:hypothetical protein
MSRPSAPSVEAITASFPYPSFPVIHTQPNREEIDKFEKMSIANAAARQSMRGGGMHGHMGMVLSPAQYAMPYVFEPNPGEAPIYSPRVTGVAQRMLNNEWQRNATIYNDQQAVHAALKNQLFRTIPEAYWAGITDPLTGMAHLENILKQWYKYTIDWMGATYCGLTLTWNYNHNRWVDVAVPGYIKRLLHKVQHPTPARPQNCPHPAPPLMFGIAAQLTAPDDESPALTDTEKKKIQQVVGSLLFYARAVDNTML